MQFNNILLDLIFNNFFVFTIIIMIIGIPLSLLARRRALRNMPLRMAHMMQQMQDVMMEVPAFAIPESQRATSGQTEVRTVRLPTKCPQCQAPVSHEGIDWVGPLQAKCNYCGASMNANFERV